MARTHAAFAALFLALAVLMTWPLTPNISRAVTDPGDPFINTWVLDWDWYATWHRLPLFDANAFYPARYSLAFTENLYGIALFLFPLRALGVAPLTAHNLAVLGGYAFSGFAAYLLGRFVSGSPLAGIAAGVFYAFVPFRFTQAGHVQHVVGGWLPLLLLALLHYSREPTWRRAAWFGAAFLFNGLTSIHALLFGSIAIVIAALILRPRWLPLLAATAIATLLLVPFLLPYREASRLYGMRRGWSETMSFSARPRDWLVTNFQNNLYRGFRDPSVNPERWLFPGLLSMVIGAIGVVSTRRKETAIAISWVLLGFLGSLGLNTVFHRFLFLHVPGFRAIRVPARWAVIAYVGLAVLVAMGTAWLSRRRKWIAVVIVVAFIVELRAAPIRWYVALPEPPPVYRWIGEARPRAIIELPIDERGGNYGYLLYAPMHHRPMVNRISGFAPPEPARLAEIAGHDPIPDNFVDELRRVGVDTVVVHGDAVGSQVRPWLQTELQRGRLSFVRRFDAGISGDWVFRVGTPAWAPALHREDLAAFLRGEPTFSEATFGVLDSPAPGARITKPWFEGFAFSPYGIREVNLLFNNGGIRERTYPLDDPALRRMFPWYDATAHPRFGRAFDRRPRGVWENTDVQVEIIDGHGRRTLLEDRWISWP